MISINKGESHLTPLKTTQQGQRVQHYLSPQRSQDGKHSHQKFDGGQDNQEPLAHTAESAPAASEQHCHHLTSVSHAGLTFLLVACV